MKTLATLLAVFAFSVLCSASAQADVVGAWSFDDAADPLHDDSDNGKDLISTLLVGVDPTYQSAGGFEGGAYIYNGDRWVAPINVNPGAMPQMTWGAWVRTDDLTAGQRKVMGHDTGGFDRAMGLDTRGGGGYSSFTGAGVLAGNLQPANTTDWTFLAAVYDVGTVTMYIDLDAATNDPLAVLSGAASFGGGWITFAIGGLRPDNGAEAWVGSIDGVFIYDEALDAAAITAIRDGGFNAIVPSVPEPSTMILSLLGLLGLACCRHQRKR